MIEDVAIIRRGEVYIPDRVFEFDSDEWVLLKLAARVKYDAIEVKSELILVNEYGDIRLLAEVEVILLPGSEAKTEISFIEEVRLTNEEFNHSEFFRRE